MKKTIKKTAKNSKQKGYMYTPNGYLLEKPHWLTGGKVYKDIESTEEQKTNIFNK